MELLIITHKKDILKKNRAGAGNGIVKPSPYAPIGRGKSQPKDPTKQKMYMFTYPNGKKEERKKEEKKEEKKMTAEKEKK